MVTLTFLEIDNLLKLAKNTFRNCAKQNSNLFNNEAQVIDSNLISVLSHKVSVVSFHQHLIVPHIDVELNINYECKKVGKYNLILDFQYQIIDEFLIFE